MKEQTTDHSVLKHIQHLAAEEHRLYGEASLGDAEQAQLKKIEVELDQCWDLLRQRQARRAAGQDPNQAQVRPPGIVENYRQ